jgi:hypothetical protein
VILNHSQLYPTQSMNKPNPIPSTLFDTIAYEGRYIWMHQHNEIVTE